MKAIQLAECLKSIHTGSMLTVGHVTFVRSSWVTCTDALTASSASGLTIASGGVMSSMGAVSAS